MTHIINTNGGTGPNTNTNRKSTERNAAANTNAASTVYAPLSGLEDPELEFEDDAFDSKEANILAQLTKRANNGGGEEDGISMTDANSWSTGNTASNTTSITAPAPTVILQNTTLSIPRGALAVVVGVTGSGKSSLLQGALLGRCCFCEVLVYCNE